MKRIEGSRRADHRGPGAAAAPRRPAHFWDLLFTPVDVASLAFFRIAFGAVVLAWAVSCFTSNWIVGVYFQPRFHFQFFGFGWVRPWPGAGMYLHFAAIAFFATCVMLGLWYRVTTALLVLAYTYAWLIEETLFQNHYYLMTLFGVLLVFIPAHGRLSLDAALRPHVRSDIAPAWGLWILRAQMAIVYFYAGVAKLNADWLHGQPMRMMLEGMVRDGATLPDSLTARSAALLLSWGGLVFDLAIVPLLLWPRTRLAALVTSVAFHLMNAILWPIDVFPWFAIAATTLFLPPDWPRRLVPGLWKRRETPPRHSQPQHRRLTIALLAAYLAVQILLPLRHLLYPGNVSWTEEGHRWAWRMMIRQKTGSTVLVVTDPDRGEVVRQSPLRYITRWQERIMVGDPDMILQLAHHVADEYRRQGLPHVEVRALASASLHQRPEQPLIDPDVDLAAQPRTLWPARWIVPLRGPLSR